MTPQEVLSRFEIYTNQIPILVENKAYWALLHYVIIFPDICSALESDDGRANKSKFINWADEYIADNMLSGAELYDIRCLLLHQGRTTKQGGRYENYCFSQPATNGTILHKCQMSDASLTIDVSVLANEILLDLDRWANDLTPEMLENVKNNSQFLADTRSETHPFGNDIAGLKMSVSASPIINKADSQDTY